MTLGRKFSTGGSLLLAILPLQVSYARRTVERQTPAAPSIRATNSSVAISKPRLYAASRPARAKFSQEEERKPVGAVNTVGEVYVNDSRAPSEATVFPGDTLRTGETGAATFTVSGLGSLQISPNSRVTFVDEPRYFAILQQGSAVMTVFGETAKFQVRTGDFVVIPGPEALSAVAEISRSADGSSRITCTRGAIGVIALEERTEAVFLKPGQYVTVSTVGELQNVMSPAGAPSESVAPGKPKKSRTGWIVLGVAGGGGGVAAAVLANRGKKPSVSPSTP
jgi:ferric-dicitrate binding protein FerR (iron transport regulator)